MSTSGEETGSAGVEKPKKGSRLQTNVKTLIALVAACALSFWAFRRVRENSDPAAVEARAIQNQAIGALQSSKVNERLTAITELQRLHTGDVSVSVGPLVAALDDPVTEVRLASAETLGSICAGKVKSGSDEGAFKQALAGLIQHSNDPDTSVRVAVINAASFPATALVKSQVGAEAVRATAKALEANLKDPEPGVRSAAARGLGKIAIPGVTRGNITIKPPLDRKAVMQTVETVLGDGDASVRRAAIGAMAAYPGASGDPPDGLAAAMKDTDAENRAAAVMGLAFFQTGLDRYVPILLHLAEHDADAKVREHCLRMLDYTFKSPSITAAAVPDLIAGLTSKQTEIRTRAASILGSLKGDARAAVPELVKVLNEPVAPGVGPLFGPNLMLDPGCAAANALGLITPGSAESSKVIVALDIVVRSGPVIRRGWAAYALGNFGPAAEEVVPGLIQLIKETKPDQNDENEPSAATALGKIAPGTKSEDLALKMLIEVLSSKRQMSRVSAIEALGRFGPKAAGAIPAIRALEEKGDLEIKNAVKKALLQIER